jgi:hypothetical protein
VGFTDNLGIQVRAITKVNHPFDDLNGVTSDIRALYIAREHMGIFFSQFALDVAQAGVYRTLLGIPESNFGCLQPLPTLLILPYLVGLIALLP